MRLPNVVLGAALLVGWFTIRQAAPRSAHNDIGNGCRADAVVRGEVLVAKSAECVEGPNRAHIGFAETHTGSTLAVSRPVLFGAVRHVRGWATEKEMIGPNAWRVVAPMKNKQTLWNRADVQFVGRTRRDQRFAFAGDRIAWRRNASVASVVTRCRPLPTTIALPDVSPEPIGEACSRSTRLMRDATREGAIATESLFAGHVRGDEEVGTALLAGALNRGTPNVYWHTSVYHFQSTTAIGA